MRAIDVLYNNRKRIGTSDIMTRFCPGDFFKGAPDLYGKDCEDDCVACWKKEGNWKWNLSHSQEW